MLCYVLTLACCLQVRGRLETVCTGQDGLLATVGSLATRLSTLEASHRRLQAESTEARDAIVELRAAMRSRSSGGAASSGGGAVVASSGGGSSAVAPAQLQRQVAATDEALQAVKVSRR